SDVCSSDLEPRDVTQPPSAEEADAVTRCAVHPEDRGAMDVVRRGQQGTIAAHGDDEFGTGSVELRLRTVQHPALDTMTVESLLHALDSARVIVVSFLPTPHGGVSASKQFVDARILSLVEIARVGCAFGDDDDA